MDDNRSYFNHIVNLINSADPNTIQILRTQSMCNIKLIERSSKSIKDPNPLMTAMSTISQKYPLSIDISKALQFNVPIHFLATKNGSFVKDTHNHGRVLCKKEAIDWWVKQSPLPRENVLGIINLLFEPCREEVRKYYNIKWGGSIRLGAVNMERRAIQTRTPLIAADKITREQIVESIFFPHLTIVYEPFPDSLTSKIKELINTKTCSKLSLPSQLRIVLNQMDPRNRILPVPASFNDFHSSFQHAVVGSNFTVPYQTNQNFDAERKDQKLLEKVARCIIYNARKQKAPINDMTECPSLTFINRLRMDLILKKRDLKESPSLKVLKTAIKEKVVFETESDGLVTSPNVASITQMTRTNQANAPYKVYMGPETVNFKYDDVRGQFSHDGTIINNITCNYTTRDEVIKAIVEIAVYCRWGFVSTNSRDYTKMKMEARKIILENIHILLRTTPPKLMKFLRDGTIGKVGILTFRSSCEYQTVANSVLQIEQNSFNLIDVRSKQVLAIPDFEVGHIVLPETVKSSSPLVVPSLSLKELLKYKIYYYSQNQVSLVKKITENDFSWENGPFNKFLGKKGRGLSGAARVISKNICQSFPMSNLLPFIYCWTNLMPAMDYFRTTEADLTCGGKVDLLFNEGILTFNEVERQFYLFNVKFESSYVLDVPRITMGLLTGYKILKNMDPNLPVYPLLHLESIQDSIPDGTMFTTFIEGKKLTIVRDSSISYDIVSTIQRQVEVKSGRTEETGNLGDYISRLMAREGVSYMEVPAKKPKKVVQDDSSDDDGGVSFDVPAFDDDESMEQFLH